MNGKKKSYAEVAKFYKNDEFSIHHIPFFIIVYFNNCYILLSVINANFLSCLINELHYLRNVYT